MRSISADISDVSPESLNKKSRVDSKDENIIEKVWLTDIGDFEEEEYSGCYVKKWYYLRPKLRLMTTNGIVKTRKRF